MNFTKQIISWFLKNKRDLPWRDTKDPYKIWLSEVILQQTRVEQGMKYFYRFTTNYPTIHHLAKAPIDQILKDWQGLGYYSRARNMHKAASIIVNEYSGVFPSTSKQLETLPGIGGYTAAAIASIAFGEALAVVDGNVIRVLSRHNGIQTPVDTSKGKNELHALAQKLVDKAHPDLFNEGMMDLGATICTPRNPSCSVCPVNQSCVAYLKGEPEIYPVKLRKQKVRDRFFIYYVILDDEGDMVIKRREKKDIWEGLYEFPLLEQERDNLHLAASTPEIPGMSIIGAHHLVDTYKANHLLSHQRIHATFHTFRCYGFRIRPDSDLLKIPFKHLEDYAVSRLTDKYIRERFLQLTIFDV